MRTLRIALLTVLIALVLLAPSAYSSGLGQSGVKTGLLSTGSYSENLSIYLTSSQAFWSVRLTGGNINVSSVTVPGSVTGYSITLTQYSTWQSSYEVFTQYGFGLLGSSEPYPNGAVLTINTTSAADAVSLANSLSSRFALAFVQTNSSSNSYTFFSPIDFNTELHVYFYNLVPQSAGGFATMFAQSQFESNGLNYLQLSYSGSTYSLVMGGITALVSQSFRLYTQLGLTQSAYNYSSIASSSSIDVYVLGGLINNSSVPFTNHISNISSTIEVAKSTNNAIPNFNASLDFSFPAILAFRHITPTLTPSSGSSVTVTITVSNVGSTSATDVFVNDTWIYSQSANFHLTQTQTSNNETLAPESSYNVIYAFTVTATSGTFNIPATQVSYSYASSNNTLAHGVSLLNPETISVAASNTPELEATASIASGTQIQVGQPYSVNVTIANMGNGAAFTLSSDGLSKQNLPAGGTWSYISNQSSSSLRQTNASLSYSVSWQDASGVSHSTSTNTINTVLGFSSPGTPSLTLAKSVGVANSNQVNVTLSVFNGSPGSVTNSSIKDTIPAGMSFVKSYNSSSLVASGSSISANLTSIATQVNESFIYTLQVSKPDNFVFLPASVTTNWDGQTITHYSGGYGLPMGIVATKVFTPNEGFQGSNVTISIGLTNEGTLPIYQVSLNNSYDSFLTITSSKSGYSAVLNAGVSLNATLNANLTGSPGVYNSSSSAASFIFAGRNQTATSSIVQVTIFHLPEANLTYSAEKVEEGHDILVTITITNPTNVTINNVFYSLTLPKDLKVVSGGATTLSIPSLAPNSNYTVTITVLTNQPDIYKLGGGKLTFEYQGHSLIGISGSLTLNINDDIPLRYGIPVIIGLVLVLATLVYVRRLVSPSKK